MDENLEWTVFSIYKTDVRSTPSYDFRCVTDRIIAVIEFRGDVCLKNSH
jgi:hypothetical protein